MRPSLESLRVLEACVSAGSFARAAERLFLTPAAVSLRIRTLEAELGQPLFIRAGRRVVPTAAASVLANRVREALTGIGEALAQLFARLRKQVDAGRFDWVHEETGAVLYSLQNYRSEPFTADSLRAMSTPGAVRLASSARVNRSPSRKSDDPASPTFATPLWPVPMPRTMRPPEIASTEAAAPAVMAGWREDRLVTHAASVTRSVRVAASVRAKPSSRSMFAMAKPIPEEPPVTRAAFSTEPSFQVGRCDADRAELGGGGTERLLLSPESHGGTAWFLRGLFSSGRRE